MADHWLKSLGRKLLDTGAAYLEQVKLVQELKSLPPDHARERFQAYVQGLSNSARAGFSLTLATLANNERHPDSKRFLEMLGAALADPSGWLASAAPPQARLSSSQPTVTRAEPGSAACNSLDEDLKIIDAWLELDDESRPGAVEAYVGSLSPLQVSSLKANLEQALANVGQRIAQHRDDEARIAAGRFVEDQMSYRMGRLAGAPPDSAWLATLRNYERIQAFLETLHRFVSAVEEERRRAPPPAAPERKADVSPDFEELRKMLEAQLSDGKIPADRAPTYRRVLEKIESVIQADARGELSPEAAHAQMQELMAAFMPYLVDPGTASARATPRGREVLRRAGALKAAVMRLLKDGPPAATTEAAVAVVRDATTAQTEAAAAAGDAALASIEAELLRPAARAWHELVLTRHAVLARPYWECNETTRATNKLFYSGARDLQESLERIAEEKRLSVDDTRPLQNHGQSRWDALNACHVAVFDLRLAPELEALGARAPKQARALTGTAYELGLAFALGKPVVLLASPGDGLPFDIDLSPVLLDGTDDDAQSIAAALDEAFYAPQRESRRNTIPAVLSELERLTRDHQKRAAFEGMGWLDPALERDPAGFSAAARQLLREIHQPGWQLLRPAWPGAHPDVAQPRCFHVMPFRPSWAGEARDTARAACKDLGLAYRRGDEAEEGCIVRAVWDDLCRASVVLVELNGGNLNVMIELGIAHALGRPVLAVRRRGGPDLRSRHIEKIRVHDYDTSAELASILTARLRPGP